MTCVIDAKSKRRLSAKLAAGLALSAFLVLGTFVASASAEERRGDDRRGGDYRGGDSRGGDYRGNHRPDDRGGHRYYRAPPVVYGSPYYNPPPVVYGPGIGITVPGINFNIR